METLPAWMASANGQACDTVSEGHTGCDVTYLDLVQCAVVDVRAGGRARVLLFLRNTSNIVRRVRERGHAHTQVFCARHHILLLETCKHCQKDRRRRREQHRTFNCCRGHAAWQCKTNSIVARV